MSFDTSSAENLNISVASLLVPSSGLACIGQVAECIRDPMCHRASEHGKYTAIAETVASYRVASCQSPSKFSQPEHHIS